MIYIYLLHISLLPISLQSIAIKMDTFEKLNCIGQGTFGKVWKCRNKNSQHVVAIKEFHGGNLEKSINRELRPITV